MDIATWIVIIAILLITIGLFCSSKGLKLPGPKALPLLGNLHQLNKTKLHVQLLQWAKQHGPVYRLWLGHKPVVVVTGSKQIHEVLVVKGKEFSGRSQSYILTKLGCNRKDFLFDDATEEHKIQKKLFITTLKGYGSGLKKIEEITTRYTTEWMEELIKKYDDTGIDIREHLVNLTYDIINTITLRETLHNKENGSMIKQLLTDGIITANRCLSMESFLLDTFTWVKYIATALPTAIDNHFKIQKAFVMSLKCKEMDAMNADKMNESNILKQNLLSKLVEYQMANSKIKLDDDMVACTMMVAYGAGILTTSGSLAYLFYILAQNKIIQGTIQAEIDSILKADCVHLEDRARMPYTHATLLEMLRFTSITPILVPHRSTTNTSIGGHHIPKDTEVWVNAWGLHHDDTVWDQPFKFMPERFLDASGDVVLADHPNRRNLVAFGAGPRVCAGETFAMSRMFLILTMVLQKFSVLPVTSGDNQPSYDTRDIGLGLFLEPPHYMVKFQPREQVALN